MVVRNVILLAAPIVIAASLPAAAETSVSFANPEQFTDSVASGGYGLDAEQPVLTELARYIESLGTWYLKPHQVLVVEITDIDLAGRYEPWRPIAYDVPIMRDIYPPRIALRYKLTDGTRMLCEGEEKIVDINYLSNPGARPFPNDPLRYEKAMLSDWFRRRLFAPKAASAGL
jgi:hypothetical protein